MQKEMREINFSKLIWKIIFAWKGILVSAIIFGALLGLGIYAMNSGDTTSNITDVEFTEAEKATGNKMLELYEQLYYYEEYMEESLVIKVNPLKYENIRLQYYVDSQYVMNIEQGVENDYTPALVSAYATYMLSDSFINQLKESFSIEQENNYVREIFTVKYDATSSTIDVAIIVPEHIKSEELLSAIRKTLEEKEVALQDVGGHQLLEVNASVDNMMSEELLKKRENIIRGYDSVKISIDNARKMLTSREKMYIEENLAYEQYKSQYVVVVDNENKIELKYVVVGAILGAFFVVAYHVLVTILSDKLQDEKDIRTLFNVKLIGTVCDGLNKKGIMNSLLNKIRYRNEETYSYSEQIDRLGTRIAILCEQKGISNVFISGCSIGMINSDIVADLQKVLEDKKITVCSVGKVNGDALSLEKAKTAQGVVLLEKIQSSKYEQIEQEIIALKDYEIPLVGAVVVE